MTKRRNLVSTRFHFTNQTKIYCEMMLAVKKNYFVTGVFMVCLVLAASSQHGRIITKPASVRPVKEPLSDDALLEMVQKQTFRYFWDFAHPVSGLSRERSNTTAEYGPEVITIGGTGFGVMSVIVAADRKWISRDTAARFLLKMVKFLLKATCYHGAFPHWMDGATGKTIAFSRRDDGADLVETSYLLQGLLCARQYFDQAGGIESELRTRIGWIWGELEWNWFTNGGQQVLYWHWSPNNGWAMNFAVRGYNECLILYILAASADRYPVSDSVYHQGWAQSSNFKNGKKFYNYELPLGFDYGGPLFYTHYSFLGLDPHGLRDRYADYWKQNLNHTLINRAYCLDNPKKFRGYGENCWGLSAGDSYDGYDAFSPTNDYGTISPTAAISSLPFTPEYSMKALRHYYYDLGDRIWGEYGFTDSFNESRNWYATSYLAIDQGPEIVMIENYRTGLLWKLFMSAPEVQRGLKKLGFESAPGKIKSFPVNQ